MLKSMIRRFMFIMLTIAVVMSLFGVAYTEGMVSQNQPGTFGNLGVSGQSDIAGGSIDPLLVIHTGDADSGEDTDGFFQDTDENPSGKISAVLSINIVTKTVLREGEELYFEALVNETVTGSVIYRWQYDDGKDNDHDGKPDGWRDVEKDNGSSILRIKANKDNFNTQWRIKITTDDNEYTAAVALKPYYRVEFVIDDTDNKIVIFVEKGTGFSRIVPKTPEKEGLLFSGWEGVENESAYTVTTDAVFTALFVNVMGVNNHINTLDSDDDTDNNVNDDSDINDDVPVFPAAADIKDHPYQDDDVEETVFDKETVLSDFSEKTEQDEFSEGTEDNDVSERDDPRDADGDEPGEVSVIHRSVSIERLMPDFIFYGDTFSLLANLVGFDDGEYEIIWEMETADGWVTMANHGVLLNVTADSQTVNCNWRVCVLPK